MPAVAITFPSKISPGSDGTRMNASSPFVTSTADCSGTATQTKMGSILTILIRGGSDPEEAAVTEACNWMFDSATMPSIRARSFVSPHSDFYTVLFSFGRRDAR